MTNTADCIGRLTRRLGAGLGIALMLIGCGGGGEGGTETSPGPAATVPTFSASPLDTTAFVGTRPVLSASVSGSPSPTLQWQRSADGVNWTDLAGATSTSLTLPTLTDADEGARLRLLASNSAGQVASSSAVIHLNKAVGVLAGQPGGPGFRDGVGEQARFSAPTALVAGPDGGWEVLDVASRLRRVAADGTVTTLTPYRYEGGEPSRVALLPGGDWVVVTNFITNLPGGFVDTSFIRLDRISRATGAAALITDQAAFNQAVGGSTPTTAMTAIASDAQGNLYLSGATCVYRLDAQGVITVVAGAAGLAGAIDGPTAQARFGSISGLALDGAGNILVSDGGNHSLRKIDAQGQVSTLAGQSGSAGSADGAGAAARFNRPSSLAFDTDGSLLVVDAGNFTLRRVQVDGQVSTVAGTALQSGAGNGTRGQARLKRPVAVAVSAKAGIAVLDDGLLRKVAADGSIQALAGLANGEGDVDGVGRTARFRNPVGVAIDSQGTIAVADSFNHLLRRVTADGTVGLLAGNRQPGSSAADGPRGTGGFDLLGDVAAGPDGTWFVADYQKVRKVAADGSLTTLRDFPGIGGLAYGSNGGLFVSDVVNRTVKRMSATGEVTLLAGQAGVTGSQDGSGAAATFSMPRGIAVDGAGNVYVADDHTVRKIDAAGVVTTVAGQPNRMTSIDGNRSTAGFQRAEHIAVDAAGQVLVADGPDLVRHVAPDGQVKTVYQGVAVQGVAVITPGRALVVDENALVLISY